MAPGGPLFRPRPAAAVARVAPPQAATAFAAWPRTSAQRCAAASFARADLRRARFFEKAFDTPRRLPYIAARRRRIRVRADARAPRFSGELYKLSSLPKDGGGAVRTSSRGELDEIEHDGDSRGACVARAPSGSGASASTAI